MGGSIPQARGTMVKLSKSQLVRQLAKKSFKECDLDNDGATSSSATTAAAAEVKAIA